jgi:predicted GNAT family N-acyltransferase
MSVRVVTTDDEREDAFAVRRAVFVEEQGVPEDLEIDEHDPEATHFVAYDDGTAVGAARLRGVDDETAKVERVAVLAERRGEGWGRRLMDAVEATAREAGFDRVTLHSQTHAADFYDYLGYERHGDVFYEADIPHVEMDKPL